MITLSPVRVLLEFFIVVTKIKNFSTKMDHFFLELLGKNVK